MQLETVIDGISKGLTEPILAMNHLAFCLMAGLMLFTLRKKPRDLWFYVIALIPGYAWAWTHPLPSLLVNLLVVATVTLMLLQQWIYEKLARITIPLLLLAGLCHGMSLTQAVIGSRPEGFLAYAAAATLVQAVIIYGFGRFCAGLSLRSPSGFEGLENVLSAVGTGVAMAYFYWAF